MDRRCILSFASLLVAFGGGCETVTKDQSTYRIVEGEEHSYLESELERLEKRSEDYPKNPDYPYRIAGIHFEQENYRESEHALRHAISLDPEQPRFHYHLGRIYLQMREMERAEDSFRKAVDLTHEERFSGPRAALAYVLALKRDIPAAIEHFEKCITIDADNVEFYYFLGALHDMQGDSANTIRYFREYLDRGGVRYRKKAARLLRQLGVTVEEKAPAETAERGPPPPAGDGLPPGIDGAYPSFGRERPRGSAPSER